MIPFPEQDQVDSLADVEQHCLLFPSYATKHPGSDDQEQFYWNVRVRGWAFSKRSNRRKRLVMGLARKIAGVTKNESVYDTLESRFSMFLASNTQGAQFIVQCVGPSKAKQMELAGDPTSSEPAVAELIRELHSPEGVLAADEVMHGKAQLRRSLEVDREGHLLRAGMNHSSDCAASSAKYHSTSSRSEIPGYSAFTSESTSWDTDRTQSFRAIEGEPTVGRLQRGAAFFKSAYTKYKAIVATQEDPNQPNPLGESTEEARSFSTSNSGSRSEASSQDSTQYRDFGSGVYPTVQVMSRPGGHFHGTLHLSRKDISAFVNSDSQAGSHPRSMRLNAYHPGMKDRSLGIVNLVDPVGLSIISDIDDTIKETNVPAGARTIMRNTFLEDMKAVDGMADVYQRWWKGGAAIHYVSNSPWQLIQSLLEFFHSQKFPPGSAHLRLHDSVLKTYFMSPSEHKHRAISEILTDFPDRKFILVGDSGEIDMEIYTHFAQLNPDQIVKIFIRDISTDRLKEMATDACTPRNESELQYFPSDERLDTRNPSSWEPITVTRPMTSEKYGQEYSSYPYFDDKSGHDAGPPTPATPKSPLEIWLDRIEDCQSKLPKDKLTLFKSADVLDSCSIARGLLQMYKTDQAFSDEGWLQGSE